MSRDPRFERLANAIKRLVREENRHSDPPSAHHIPHDVAYWFVRLLSGDEKKLGRALGLLRPPGRPVDPNTSKNNLNRAELAFTLRMQGKTWAEVNNAIFAEEENPPDERRIRRLVTQYEPLLMRRWLCRGWRAQSEERKQRAILKNSRRGKAGNFNSRVITAQGSASLPGHCPHDSGQSLGGFSMTTTAISKPPAIPSPMLSVAEACEYLKVRKSFLYVLIGSGDLPARKLGTRTFILKSDADDLIESLPQTPIHDARTRAEDGGQTPSYPGVRTEE